MRLPHTLLDSPLFLFGSVSELLRALGSHVDENEQQSIEQLAQAGLPPVTSRLTLAAMLGLNPGLVWSIERKTEKHYRTFYIPKGNGQQRRIDAPRVALKLIQKWLSIQLGMAYTPTDHVFGFVTGRSHVDAARVHVNARWVLSVDIRDFFQSTPQHRVIDALRGIGFPDEGAELIATLACLRGALAQGAPTSPVLSNICFSELDDVLSRIAKDYDIRLSRYADDIVFSGEDEYPSELHSRITALFEGGPWQLASQKTSVAIAPKRLKVHGLLVSGSEVRLTKGYRNRLRAYDHLINKKGGVKPEDLAKMQGHLAYGDFVAKLSSSGTQREGDGS